MKNNKIYFIIFILLLVAVGALYLNHRNGTIKPELRDFAIQDTSQVTKIFMVNKKNKSVTLERNASQVWMVNQHFIARKDAIDLILKTFKRMDVKSPVSKAAFDNTVKLLAATHVKIEIYTNDDSKPEKTIYIGGPTQDMYGTYMMIEGSNTPFIVHIPGFSGYLSSRFFLNENDWRDCSLFKYAYNDIRSVSLENFKKPSQSFIANNLGANQFSLTRFDNKTEVANFDTIRLKQYLGYFKKVGFEKIVEGMTEEKTDSIINSEPIYNITVKNRNNEETNIKAFLKPGTGLMNYNGEMYEYDLERMYGQINGASELVLIQYFVFDILLMDLDYFIRK